MKRALLILAAFCAIAFVVSLLRSDDAEAQDPSGCDRPGSSEPYCADRYRAGHLAAQVVDYPSAKKLVVGETPRNTLVGKGWACSVFSGQTYRCVKGYGHVILAATVPLYGVSLTVNGIAIQPINDVGRLLRLRVREVAGKRQVQYRLYDRGRLTGSWMKLKDGCGVSSWTTSNDDRFKLAGKTQWNSGAPCD